jgi:nucleotide-binding universal stress UspA family protein
MIRSILVPLDGSETAERALPLAAAIARACRAKLRLVSVHQPPPAPRGAAATRTYISLNLKLRRAERAYLKQQAARVRTDGRPVVSTVTLDGPVAGAIASHVRRADVGLVVMTTHGRGPLNRLWLGSVADELVRMITVPLLLVRAAEGAPPAPPAGGQRVLVPLDGSDLGEAALEPAAELAAALGLRLTLVRVVQPAPLLGDGMGLSLPAAEDMVTGLEDEAKVYLEGAAEPLRSRGIEADRLAIVRWSVVDALLELSRAADVAMIALSTHGRGGLKRALLGSVADKLVRAAERPVLVVRPAGPGRRRRRTSGGARARKPRRR